MQLGPVELGEPTAQPGRETILFTYVLMWGFVVLFCFHIFLIYKSIRILLKEVKQLLKKKQI